MSQIETTHNEHKVIYREQTDTWECRPLDLSAKTLSALRTKINKVDADARRIDNIPVLILSYGGRVTQGVATLIDGDEAWVNEKDGNGYSRRKHKLNTLIIDGPAMRAAISDARALTKAADEAGERSRAAWAAIKRVTVEDLKAIPKAEDAA